MSIMRQAKDERHDKIMPELSSEGMHTAVFEMDTEHICAHERILPKSKGRHDICALVATVQGLRVEMQRHIDKG